MKSSNKIRNTILFEKQIVSTIGRQLNLNPMLSQSKSQTFRIGIDFPKLEKILGLRQGFIF